MSLSAANMRLLRFSYIKPIIRLAQMGLFLLCSYLLGVAILRATADAGEATDTRRHKPDKQQRALTI
jgi:hypothetical protein